MKRPKSMKSRQWGAICHPVRRVPGSPVEPPHKNRIERVGTRVSILEVSHIVEGVWVWQASLSYQGPHSPGRPLHLGAWKPSQVRKADKTLRKMLEGVGDSFVFGIQPGHVELDTWKAMGLDQLEIISDADAIAFTAEMEFLHCPPSRVSAMHLWKSVTDDELALIREAMN